MGCDEGQFADKRVRQALALTFDREQMLDTLFQGRAEHRQRPRDRPVHARSSTTPSPQRTTDIDTAKAAARRGRRRGRPAGHAARRRPAGDPPAGPADPGRRGRGGHRARDRRRERRHVLRHPVVPGRRRPAVRRRGRAGHRRLRPPRRRPTSSCNAPSQDRWRLELVAVLRTRSSTRRSPSTRPPSASRRRPAACEKIETILNEDVPVGHPVLLQLPVGPLEELPGRAGDGARPDVPRQGVAGLISRCTATRCAGRAGRRRDAIRTPARSRCR